MEQQQQMQRSLAELATVTAQDVTPYQAGQEIFNVPRQETDRDLIKEVREAMVNAGISEDVLSRTYDVNRWIVGARDRLPVVQRYFLGNFVNVACACTLVDTHDLRSALVPASSEDHWMKLMTEKVVPMLAENKVLGV